jgi:hypothetical protein
MSDSRRFAFRFDPAYARLGRLFGVRPANSWVELDATSLRARYGRWRVTTPLSNVSGVDVTGPYRMFKTAGPARLAITDRGLSFTSNGDRGVLITFHEKVRGMDPLRHPELTVTVADVDGLAEALRAHLA